jgi:hypothetical protein
MPTHSFGTTSILAIHFSKNAFHLLPLSQLFEMYLCKGFLHMIGLLYLSLEVVFPLEDGLQCLSFGWEFFHLKFFLSTWCIYNYVVSTWFVN